MLCSLSEDCLSKILYFVDSAQDLLNLSLTSRTLYQVCNSSQPWTNYLHSKFGVPVKYSSLKRLKVACLQVQKQQEEGDEQLLRFLALYTNGGVQDQSMHFWVDQIFSFTSYCSEFMQQLRSLDIFSVFCGTMKDFREDYSGYYATQLYQNRRIVQAGDDQDQLLDVGNLSSKYVLDNHFKERISQIQSIQLHNTNGRLTCPVVTGVVFISTFPQSSLSPQLTKETIQCNIENSLQNFTFFNSIQNIEQAAARLPVVRSERKEVGSWYEFDRNFQWGKQSQKSNKFCVKPMFMFHFWTRDELQGMRGDEALPLEAEEVLSFLIGTQKEEQPFLNVELTQQWFGNGMFIKLIEQEVKSVHHQWWQLVNIDLHHVEVRGQSFTLPDGVEFDV
eukprot:TRINITY_DN41513_c0_g3_i1.p1 TRINITY_DN41513_c0_g3~~TRINITY_DN41513_c0_g3_i1.p1  ORF type:complete len:427 (-),score=28.44 TRINITY_DN41513_c0_g3_i1:1462-2631(-)